MGGTPRRPTAHIAYLAAPFFHRRPVVRPARHDAAIVTHRFTTEQRQYTFSDFVDGSGDELRPWNIRQGQASRPKVKARYRFPFEAGLAERFDKLSDSHVQDAVEKTA